jgi:hypothetical protein
MGVDAARDGARIVVYDGYADLRVMPTCGGKWLLGGGGVVEVVGIIRRLRPSLLTPISEKEERWVDRPAGSAMFV